MCFYKNNVTCLLSISAFMLCLLVWTDKSINTSLRDGGNDWEIYNLNHFKFYFPCSFRGASWWKWVIIWIFKRHLNDQCHQRRQQGILGETPFWDNLFSSPLTRTHVAHANIRKYFRNTCHTTICLCKIKRGGGWLSLRNWWPFKKRKNY